MSKAKPPRILLIKRDKARKETWRWTIVDRGKQKAAGKYDEKDPDGLGKPTDELHRYCAAKLDLKPSQPIDLSKISVDEVLEHLSRTTVLRANASSREIKNHIAVVSNVKALREYWTDKTLADVTVENCQAYCKSREGREFAKPRLDGQLTGTGGARNELSILSRAISRYGAANGIVLLPRVYYPKRVVGRQEKLQRSEVARLLGACRGRVWDRRKRDWKRKSDGSILISNNSKKTRRKGVARFILVGVYSGTRHDAILRLRWKLSDDAGYPSTDFKTLHRRGLAETDTLKLRTPCKIPRRLQGHLRRWEKTDRLGCRKSSHIVHTSTGEAYQSYIHDTFKTVVRDAGLNSSKLKPHAMRYACAYWLKLKAVPIWIAADYLGMTVDTLERIYSDRMLEAQQPATDALDNPVKRIEGGEDLGDDRRGPAA